MAAAWYLGVSGEVDVTRRHTDIRCGAMIAEDLAAVANSALKSSSTRPRWGHGPVSLWKPWTGYLVRSRAEARMRCLKSFGERIELMRWMGASTASVQSCAKTVFQKFSTAGVFRRFESQIICSLRRVWGSAGQQNPRSEPIVLATLSGKIVAPSPCLTKQSSAVVFAACRLHAADSFLIS